MFLLRTAILAWCLSAVVYSNEDFLLVTDTQQNSIYQVNVTSGRKTPLPVGNITRPFALDYDYKNDYVYWSELGKIVRSHRNGTGKRELVFNNITAEGLALDLAGHNIYWTDVVRKTISVARADGSYQRTLISENLDQPKAIALQPANGYMYWADCGDQPKIKRAAMDGSGRTTLINTQLGKPYGLAIDLKHDLLYWCDGGDPYYRLERSDLLGNNRRVVVSYPNTRFLSIALDNGNIYWTARDFLKLARTSESNTGLRVAIGSGYGELNGIHLHRHDVTSDVSNACSSSTNGCHHLCLALPGGRTCACRDSWILQDDESTCTPPDIQLVGGSSYHEGRVEVLHNRVWGTVCDDNWTIHNARVVCRQLGYPDALEAKTEAHFGQGSTRIWLDEVGCTGQETSLSECSHRGWGVSSGCTHLEDAGVICMLDVRVMGNGTAHQGRVEVLHNGVWGTVCDLGWDQRDADVVCRQLGYPEAARAETAASFGEGNRPIWGRDVTCTGHETSLTKCGHVDGNVSSCNHSRDAGVVCQLLAVRLVGGSAPHEGRVEVFYRDKWGTVCDDNWDLRDARVICRRLGYPDAASAVGSAHFGEGSGPVWLDDLYCDGNETGLSECGHNGLGVANCEHREDAGVVCTPHDGASTTAASLIVTCSEEPGASACGTTTATDAGGGQNSPNKQTGTTVSNTTLLIVAVALSGTFALVGVVTLVSTLCVFRRRRKASTATILNQNERAMDNHYHNANPAFCFDDNPVYCTAENTYDVVRDRPTPPVPSGAHPQAARGTVRLDPLKFNGTAREYQKPVKQAPTEEEMDCQYVDMKGKNKVYEN